jgi:hypothetical protein
MSAVVSGVFGALLFGAWAVCGCATVSSAEPAVPVDEHGRLSKSEVTASGLRVSGEELSALSSPYFGALEVTFENESAAWVHIEHVRLDFGRKVNDRVLLPWGEDIRSWYDATIQRNRIRATNRELALGVVALTGLAAAQFGSDGVQKAGGLVAVGALGTLAGEARQEAVQSAERVRFFPDDHLLAGPFGVPPALFVKRWIVLNTQDSANAPCIERVMITYVLRDHRYERVLLKFKRPTEWQRSACAKNFQHGAQGT